MSDLEFLTSVQNLAKTLKEMFEELEGNNE